MTNIYNELHKGKGACVLIINEDIEQNECAQASIKDKRESHFLQFTII